RRRSGAFQNPEGGFNSENSNLVGMLFGRGNDAPVGNHWMDGGNVVKAHHEYFAGFACGLDRRHGAEGHAVVAAEYALEVRIAIEQRGSDIVPLIDFPVAALDADEVQTSSLYSLFESKPPLLAVESCWNAFDDSDFVARFKALGQRFTNLTGACSIIRANKWDGEASLLDCVRIQFVVDIHNSNASGNCPFQNSDECLGIRRRDDDRIHATGNHLFD